MLAKNGRPILCVGNRQQAKCYVHATATLGELILLSHQPTRDGTRARNLLFRRERPYPLGHTSDVYRLKPLDAHGIGGTTAGYMRLLHAHCCVSAGVLSFSQETPQPCDSRVLRHLIPEIRNDPVIQRASPISERASLSLISGTWSHMRRVRIELTTLGLWVLRATNCAIAAMMVSKNSSS